jgi:hypothetical protein
LGDREKVDVTVTFYPSGTVVRKNGVAADATLVIGEDGTNGVIVPPVPDGGVTGTGRASATSTGGASSGGASTNGSTAGSSSTSGSTGSGTSGEAAGSGAKAASCSLRELGDSAGAKGGAFAVALAAAFFAPRRRRRRPAD